MKNNLPKYLFYVLLGSLGFSLLSGIFGGGVFLMGLCITGVYLSPAIFLVLLGHKLFTWKVKNKYFYPTLGLSVSLTSIVLYIVSHIF